MQRVILLLSLPHPHPPLFLAVTDFISSPTSHILVPTPRATGPRQPTRTLRRSSIQSLQFHSATISLSTFTAAIFIILPISTPTRTLRRSSDSADFSKKNYFNMAHLGVNVGDNIRCDVVNPYLLTWRNWGML